METTEFQKLHPVAYSLPPTMAVASVLDFSGQWSLWTEWFGSLLSFGRSSIFDPFFAKSSYLHESAKLLVLGSIIEAGRRLCQWLIERFRFRRRFMGYFYIFVIKHLYHAIQNIFCPPGSMKVILRMNGWSCSWYDSFLLSASIWELYREIDRPKRMSGRSPVTLSWQPPIPKESGLSHQVGTCAPMHTDLFW